MQSSGKIKMKTFKDFIKEQVVPEGSTTSDPEFLEKKARRDAVTVSKDTKKTEQISRQAKSSVKSEMEHAQTLEQE